MQIDESLIAHQKYWEVKAIPASRWVFGIYDPVKKVGYLELVPNQKAKTLLPLIESKMLKCLKKDCKYILKKVISAI